MKKLMKIFVVFSVVFSLVWVFFFKQTSPKLKIQNREKIGNWKRIQQPQFDIKLNSEKQQRNNSNIWNGEKNGNDERSQQPQQAFAKRKNLIILSPGRGGSSFLGSLFDNNPHVMYWFEPLYTTKRLVSPINEPTKYKEACIKLMANFFKCDFGNISKTTLSAFSLSKFRIKSQALSAENLPQFSGSLLSKTCNNRNYTVIKILSKRLPNKTIETLKELFQQQNQYNMKLVHLVRDPRAIINSWVNLHWIKNHSDPSFRKTIKSIICDPVLQNIRFGLFSPPPWLKNRFKVIRYEDLVVNTVNITRELYRFAEFDWSSSIDRWLSVLANNTNQGNAFSLNRNVSAAMNDWRNAPKPFLEAVEDVCGDLMDLVGYEKITKSGQI